MRRTEGSHAGVREAFVQRACAGGSRRALKFFVSRRDGSFFSAAAFALLTFAPAWRGRCSLRGASALGSIFREACVRGGNVIRLRSAPR